ncbi:hypothetical protein C1646_663041 [Rhizophagus diaphanus]|nr:hypothetical protein C1646_663041 [Rhizophagus diaphanus] [Rhizophagus sp. MUCL 43196]
MAKLEWKDVYSKRIGISYRSRYTLPGYKKGTCYPKTCIYDKLMKGFKYQPSPNTKVAKRQEKRFERNCRRALTKEVIKPGGESKEKIIIEPQVIIPPTMTDSEKEIANALEAGWDPTHYYKKKEKIKNLMNWSDKFHKDRTEFVKQYDRIITKYTNINMPNDGQCKKKHKVLLEYDMMMLYGRFLGLIIPNIRKRTRTRLLKFQSTNEDEPKNIDIMMIEERYSDDEREEQYSNNEREEQYSNDENKEQYTDDEKKEQYSDNENEEQCSDDENEEQYSDTDLQKIQIDLNR